MTRTALLVALAAAASLAGCNNDSHTIVAGPDGDAANQAPPTNGPVELPPTIASSKTYRCKDNTIVSIDWLSDNKTANFRGGEDQPVVQLTAPEPGQPLTAEGGYSLTGTAEGSGVSLTLPGKGAQSCKA